MSPNRSLLLIPSSLSLLYPRCPPTDLLLLISYFLSLSLFSLISLTTVDCQQLKQMGARSAGRSAACITSFRLPACATWERGEGPGTLIWTWAKRGGHGPRGEDLGGAWQRAEHYQHARKDEPFNFYNSSPGPSTCTWRELETGPYNTAESGWGPNDWSALSPTAVHRDKRTTSWLACWTLRWGLCGTGRGGTYVEAQHRAAESEWGPLDRSMLSPMGSTPG